MEHSIASGAMQYPNVSHLSLWQTLYIQRYALLISFFCRGRGRAGEASSPSSRVLGATMC